MRKLDHILSVLSIKSAILEDSGNYSCLLGATNHSDTVRITVVNGMNQFLFLRLTKMVNIFIAPDEQNLSYVQKVPRSSPFSQASLSSLKTLPQN